MVRRLDALIAAARTPRGPIRREFWRSPLRGPWLTAVLGAVLLVGITVLFVTGLLSYDAYNPRLAGNDETKHHGILGAYLFTWPTHPSWLYWLTQGIHVTLGLVLVPVLLAKLWSVIPKLFELPPVRSVSHLLERLSLLLLVGGVIFEFVTGILDIQNFYRFPGSFYTLHFYGAWVFIAAFVAHVALRFPAMVRGVRSRRLRDVARTDATHTQPDPTDHSGLVSPAPAAATISRRGALGLVGAGSLSIFVLTAGQTLGGGFRHLALLAPRGRDPGSGPNGFQINRTAAEARITAEETGETWQLMVASSSATATFSRAELLAMPQHHASLPIACVEGWSSGNQEWTGVPLRALANAVGVDAPIGAYVESLQVGGSFSHASLAGNQVRNPDSLLALHVNGADLSMDHGYPARVIIPAAPGVHNTKWVSKLTFQG